MQGILGLPKKYDLKILNENSNLRVKLRNMLREYELVQHIDFLFEYYG